MAEIEDQYDCERWLAGNTPKAHNVIASRSAVRSLPSMTADEGTISESVLLPCLRAGISAVIHSVELDGPSGFAAARAASALDTIAAVNGNSPSPLGHYSVSAGCTAILAAANCALANDTQAEALQAINNSVFVIDEELAKALDAVESDMEKIDSGFSARQVYQYPLWPHHSLPNGWRYLNDEFISHLEATPEFYTFWADWYRAILNGDPLDWDLQRQVATLENRVWDAGPEAVAAEIEQIKARTTVEVAFDDLRDSLNTRVSARLGIGGNNPPESIPDAHLAGSITLIWEAENELSGALEEEKPDRERIDSILAKFKSGLAGFLKWCASKGDLAVDTLIKWGIPAIGAGYVALYPEKIKALIEAIERWLPFLP